MIIKSYGFHFPLIAVLVALLTGCESTPPLTPNNSVVVPPSDSTPPIVGMIITDKNGVHSVLQPMTLRTSSASVTVATSADDNDGGIKALRLWAVYTFYREGSTSGPGLVGAPIREEISNAQVGSPTLKHRSIYHTFELKEKLGSYSGLKIDVWADGENFHGGKTKIPTASIIYP